MAAICLAMGVTCASAEPRRLNNFVAELLNVKAPQAAAMQTFTFENPREGWVFFTSTAHVEGQQGVVVMLQPQTAPVLWHRPGRPDTVEAMRYLPKGAYVLAAQSVQGAALTSLTVRAIADIVFDVYGIAPHFKGYGTYDVDFLRRAGVVDTCNTMTTVPELADDFVLEWTKVHGKHILGETQAIEHIDGKDATAETAFRFWAEKDDAFPASSGVIVDDFRMDESMAKYGAAWRTAFESFSRERPDRRLCIYLGGRDGKELEPFAGKLLSTRAIFALEFYLPERKTEAQEYISSRLVKAIGGFQSYAPDFQKRLIVTLGFLCGAPESLNRNPAASYKTYLDMQFHELATNPMFDGTRGVELYRSSYCDDEYLRWGIKLCRHYCIEGSTKRLSSDPYELDHIANPDFIGGLNGWTVSAAEQGSMDGKMLLGHGRAQGRYPPSTEPEVDSFLWTKRQANRPNKVSQTIRNLTPGRAYSIKLFVGDYAEMTNAEKLHAATPKKHAVHIAIENVDVVAEHSFNDTIRSREGLNDEAVDMPCFNLIRVVFRPRAQTARLEISDWASPTNPGGPIGQELTFSFVEVEPFFMPGE